MVAEKRILESPILTAFLSLESEVVALMIEDADYFI